MYKYLLITIFYLLLYTLISSQDISKILVIGKSEHLDTELISNQTVDANGEQCAGLVISTDLTGLAYDSNDGIIKIDPKPGSDLLFLSPTERVVYIYKSGYESLKINLSEFDINLRSGQVWKLKVTGKKILDMIPIHILTTPSELDIYVDDEYKGNVESLLVNEGEHKLRIEGKGYRTKIDTILVTVENNLFKISLDKIELERVTFRSIPKGAQILINGDIKGETDYQDWLHPGLYNVKLIKSGFIEIEKEIKVVEGNELKNNFPFNLKKNKVELKFNISPLDATVSINKKKYDYRNMIELAPGSYQIDISKKGYNDISEYIELKLGKSITKKYEMEPITGALKFKIFPIDAYVTLKQNDVVIDSWNGAKIIDSLRIGKYFIECKMKNYVTQTKQIEINERGINLVNLTLDKPNQFIDSAKIKKARIKKFKKFSFFDWFKYQLSEEALNWIHTPYKYGGSSRSGIDASALTQIIYKKCLNVSLPRSILGQYKGSKIFKDTSNLMFGDLVYFDTNQKTNPGHVGIYLDSNIFVHVSSSRGVMVSSLRKSYWSSRFIGANRIGFKKLNDKITKKYQNVSTLDRIKGEISLEILNWLHTPYLNGGATKMGIDASSLTQVIYKRCLNVLLPRSILEQYTKSKIFKSISNLMFGDLVYFNTNQKTNPGHVGIYLDNNVFVHASSSRGVMVSSLVSGYWSTRFVGANRIKDIIKN
jgi:cell wall-associated NlpC family hydrolase